MSVTLESIVKFNYSHIGQYGLRNSRYFQHFVQPYKDTKFTLTVINDEKYHQRDHCELTINVNSDNFRFDECNHVTFDIPGTPAKKYINDGKIVFSRRGILQKTISKSKLGLKEGDVVWLQLVFESRDTFKTSALIIK